ncbi:class I SAM-dependent methyltransferase [Hoyosella sp. YIM 151337]|uniref:class I SAM-dependent methyltransferase n=1 Tax=Hoyosella sp. YIM 151337 TaxID=2992742 RepID=UPI0022369580|nr:methyltransferase domain-containing protein [Hoyosella sp. YIM 151337]MCW4353488.1 class I SAM-dependent methyltransferase [Hoyosella sp. YIM 151337]
MSAPDLAKTFNAAGADFERVTPLVWGPAAQVLVHQLAVQPGDHVLDVCAGTGASALAAALAAGPSGGVRALDLARELLAVGQGIAETRGLRNVVFEEADVTSWQPSRAAYDALACSYGVFFLPDMDEQVERLLGFLRPDGRAGFTVWLHGALEDYAVAFGDALKHVTGAEGPARRPVWEDNIVRINQRESLTAWLHERGLVDVSVTVLSSHIPVTETFAWDFVRGSGMRGALLALQPEVVTAVREEFLAMLGRRGITMVDASTLVATGRRPSCRG